jgi:hypothetical protein
MKTTMHGKNKKERVIKVQVKKECCICHVKSGYKLWKVGQRMFVHEPCLIYLAGKIGVIYALNSNVSILRSQHYTLLPSLSQQI